MRSYIPTIVGMICLVIGFSMFKLALGFICVGVLLLAPLFFKGVK